jgi:hypothetical protein
VLSLLEDGSQADREFVADHATAAGGPKFGDYLYLAFTNATAFSPTDTLPTSRWSKMNVMLQSAIALLFVH